MTVSHQKKKLRLTMRKSAAALSRAEMHEQSEHVFGRIESLDKFKSADTVAAFWAISDELPTQKFVERWAGKKRMLLPVTVNGSICFKKYTPGDELTEGSLRVLEPKTGEVVSPAEIDFVIVPGVAFDREGYRLGRGKACYDKFLAGCGAYKAGVCMKHQIVDRVPRDDHDMAMDIVIYPHDE